MNVQTEAELRRELFTSLATLASCVGVISRTMPQSPLKDSVLKSVETASTSIEFCRAYIADNGAGNHRRWACRQCGGEMTKGQALAQTYTSGEADFPGDSEGITMSVGGPGKLIPCLKCKDCGHSETLP